VEELMAVRTVVHEVFGEVEFDLESDENWWESEVDVDGRTISVSLLFEGAAVDDGLLDRVAPYVTGLPELAGTARAAIIADLTGEPSEVGEYIEHHLEEPGIVEEVFGGTAPDTGQFLARLSLVHVGIHAAGDRYEAVLDHSIGQEVTQYVLAVKFDGNRVTELVTES
jgi:hypothetical protein